MKGNSHSRLAINMMVPQLESTFLEDAIVSFLWCSCCSIL